VIILGLYALGMPIFDSVCHSFAALATGGFSPYDASIEYYRNSGHPNYIWLEYVLIIGMMMGGINFLVHFRVLTRHPKALIDNSEMRYWWGLIAFFTALIMAERFMRIESYPIADLFRLGFLCRFEDDFRTALFQVVSILTTTGFGTRTFPVLFWRGRPPAFSSHDGDRRMRRVDGWGIKVLRVVILNKLFHREVYRLRVPANAITTVVVDGKAIDLDEIQRVASLFFAWVMLLVFGGWLRSFFRSTAAMPPTRACSAPSGTWAPVTSPWRTSADCIPLSNWSIFLDSTAFFSKIESRHQSQPSDLLRSILCRMNFLKLESSDESERNSGRLWRSAIAVTRSEGAKSVRIVLNQEPKEAKTS